MPRSGETFEYKVVPAPHQGMKAKGAKTTADRFALSLETLMNALGAEGWDYVRADTLPCEERKGLTGTATTYQNMLVFRRVIAATVETPDIETSVPAPPTGAPAPTRAAAQPVPSAPPILQAPGPAGPDAPRPRRSAWGARNPAPLVAGGDATGTDPRTGRASAPGPVAETAPEQEAAPRPEPRTPIPPEDLEAAPPPSGAAPALTGPAARAARLMGSALRRPDLTPPAPADPGAASTPADPGTASTPSHPGGPSRMADPAAAWLHRPPVGPAAHAAAAPEPRSAPATPDGPPLPPDPDPEPGSAAPGNARRQAVDASTAARAAAAALRIYQASTQAPGPNDTADPATPQEDRRRS